MLSTARYSLLFVALYSLVHAVIAQQGSAFAQEESIMVSMNELEEIIEESECSPSDEDNFSDLAIEEKSRTKWTYEERANFIKECVATAEEGLGANKSRQYCHCMLFEVENKYPTASSADQMTKEDARPLAVECMGNPEWPEATQSQFLENCIGSATKGGMEEEKALNYCNCMVYKLAFLFPDPNDYNLNEDEISVLADMCLLTSEF